MTLSRSSKDVDALLAEHGFNRHGSTWVRERASFADVIDVQRGKSVEGVTVNVALMHAPTFTMTWDEPPNSPPSEPHCIVRTRLGFLLDGRDRWWRPDDASAITEMTEALASAALPFLAGFEDLQDVERWLDASKANRYPPEALYLAAVKHQRGNVREARDIVEQLLKRTATGAWHGRVVVMAASLG